jgi:hypothetical protein
MRFDHPAVGSDSNDGPRTHTIPASRNAQAYWMADCAVYDNFTIWRRQIVSSA